MNWNKVYKIIFSSIIRNYDLLTIIRRITENETFSSIRNYDLLTIIRRITENETWGNITCLAEIKKFLQIALECFEGKPLKRLSLTWENDIKRLLKLTG